MAIQNRRGVYSDFTPTKMVPGEFAVVNSGDPNSTTGKGVYISFADGQAKRLIMEEDIQNEIAKSTEEIAEQIEEAVADDLEAAQTAATTASTKASEAAASATQAAQTVANIIDNTLTQTGKAADAKVVGDELTGVKNDLNTKANIDGSYETLTAGQAEQLIGDKYTEESVPYLFRKAGGSADIGNREADMLVGGTVVWNQLCNSSSITITNGHKYYMIKGGTKSIGASTGTAITGLTSGTDIVIDLTQMFGSTIADYIYSLEQATAGAGVEFFRKLFPNDYYEYNAGELISVSGVSAHEMVGFNLWDEEWEVGALDVNNGNKRADDGCFRSKNYIPILPNTAYYFGGTGIRVVFYDLNKNFIESPTGLENTVYTTKSKAYFAKFYKRITPVVYNNDICINFSDPTRNGEYKPYKKHSYPLDDSLTLRGIPKLDANNNLYYNGDTYEHDGTVTRKYGIVDLGTLNWTKSTNEFRSGVLTQPPFAPSSQSSENILSRFICSEYELKKTASEVHRGATGVAINTDACLWARNDAFSDTDAASFKAAMSGVMLVYELATPTTETADAFVEYQVVDKYGTEEYVSTSIVPVGHVTKYYEDLTQKIERLPKDFSTLIAPTEATYIATQNYSTGNLFIVDNILYYATANIANGSNITPGTNCIATTLYEFISAFI